MIHGDIFKKITSNFEGPMFDKLKKRVLYEEPISRNCFAHVLDIYPRHLAIRQDLSFYLDLHFNDKIIMWEDMGDMEMFQRSCRYELDAKKHII